MHEKFLRLVSGLCLMICFFALSGWFYTWRLGDTSRGQWFFAAALFSGLFALLARRETDKGDD
jgi:hypothetical protein